MHLSYIGKKKKEIDFHRNFRKNQITGLFEMRKYGFLKEIHECIKMIKRCFMYIHWYKVKWNLKDLCTLRDETMTCDSIVV